MSERDYTWEDMREDEEIEYAYAEEREREAEEAEEEKRRAREAAFDAGFAEYEASLIDRLEVAAGPIACSTAAIDEGMGEPLPPEPKGTLTARECTRETTCSLCDGPMSPGDWTVKVYGRDTHTHCAGDDGWEVS